MSTNGHVRCLHCGSKLLYRDWYGDINCGLCARPLLGTREPEIYHRPAYSLAVKQQARRLKSGRTLVEVQKLIGKKYDFTPSLYAIFRWTS